MTKRADVLPKPTPIGLRRVDAAAYVGLSATKFDEAVEKMEMPPPREICGVKVWPVRKLAEALDPNAVQIASPWDA